jgi:hypothetical protein
MSETSLRRLLPADHLLVTFIGLQCLDLFTTLLVFGHGGVELNPVVRSLGLASNPVLGVVASKGALMALAFPLSRRRRALVFGNWLYAAIVLWNIGIYVFGR